MEDQVADKVLPKETVVKNLEEEVTAQIAELEYNLIPHLKHGEAKRLLIASLKYPQSDTDFSGDNETLIRAYSVSKALKDNLVGLAVEVVIERLIQNQSATKEEAVEGDNHG
jgi:hypothetical protein